MITAAQESNTSLCVQSQAGAFGSEAQPITDTKFEPSSETWLLSRGFVFVSRHKPATTRVPSLKQDSHAHGARPRFPTKKGPDAQESLPFAFLPLIFVLIIGSSAQFPGAKYIEIYIYILYEYCVFFGPMSGLRQILAGPLECWHLCRGSL